jgi:hypothetical protein
VNRHGALAANSAGKGSLSMPTVRDANSISLSWPHWQKAVVGLLRKEFAEMLSVLQFDDVDWEAWRTYYDAGRSPLSAVNRALERDF